ncbi:MULTISPECIES: hypothetical protein [unclassified Lentimicrobium]|uniref:hypothetical protein n=1 Tax=unclassified Lentimicrobium TaxID=2677434 RepID=UPI0015583337|nr:MULTISPECIES: hypothetical protein [unclassified Lentimicrobium]NPD48202.1 hypothetical protein [Lentimicrobium sp. S6]NPD86835.1 hypothetical protein [Lentimicrobium sp. L6]
MSVAPYNAKVNLSTIPLHFETLEEISGNLFYFDDNAEIHFVFKGLEPFVNYDVWIFGVRDGHEGINKHVSIKGDGMAINFDQLGISRNLLINDQIGESQDSLSDYSISVPASTDGEISFTVTTGFSLFAVAGLAIDINTPTVQTDSVHRLSATAGIFYGNVLNIGEPNLSQHGFCWNTTGSPNLNDSITEGGTLDASGNYATTIPNLIEHTTYFVRSYATNKTGTEYGDEIVYTHLPSGIPLSNYSIAFTLLLLSLFIGFHSKKK